MAFAAFPFFLIGVLFLAAAVGSLLIVVDVISDRSDKRLGPVAGFFFACMFCAGAFIYFGTFLLMKGMPL